MLTRSLRRVPRPAMAARQTDIVADGQGSIGDDGAEHQMPKLYESLAEWWPLLSAPSEYDEEAAIYAEYLVNSGTSPARTLVEFGSGGGNNASHLKRHFQMTLVDVSPGMLAVSRELNPECEHVEADMRTVRLGRMFDRVLIHDAICYMTTTADLRRAVDTAFVSLPSRWRGSVRSGFRA